MANKEELKEEIEKKKEEKPKVKMIEVKCPHCGKMNETPKKEYSHKWTVVHCFKCKRYIFKGTSYLKNPKL